MKQVFYKGLLALTIAFGMTSCDKNEMEQSGPITSVTKGLTSKVSFGEVVGLKGDVKSKSDAASKNHSEFGHLYSSDPQSIVIRENIVGGEVVFMGTYGANAISDGILPLDGYAVPIILVNGDYSALTMNEGDDSASYLPYGSSADFTLNSNTGVIALQASLEKGFLIVDAQRATEGGRITGVTATKQAEGDAGVAGSPISLLEDDRDELNDHFAYLAGGTYDIVVSYLLDSNPATIDAGEIRIGVGAAYTLEVGLNSDTPVSTRTATETVFGQEATLNNPRSINADGDILDGLSRLSTTLFTTTSGVEDDGVVSLGPWSVISDINVSISVTTATVTSTEALQNINVNPGSEDGQDDDMFDIIQKIVTTTTTSTTDLEDVSNDVDGAWTLVSDYSTAGFGETAGGPSDGPVANGPDTLSAFSAWGPLTAPATEEMIAQTRTRTVMIVDAEDDTPPVGDLTESRSIPNTAYDSGVDTITYNDDFTEDSGSRVDGVSTGVVFTFSDVDYDYEAAARVVADASGFSAEVTIIRTESFADDAFTESQTFTVVVVGLPDAITPEADASMLTRNGSSTNDNVSSDITYTTPAAPVVATWGDSGDDVTIGGATYDIFSKDGEELKYVVDQDPITGAYGYIILNANNTVHTSNLGNSDDAADAAADAQAAIALL